MTRPSTFRDYERHAASTRVYPKEQAVTYPVLGLAGEAGEMANKWKKVLRGDLTTVDATEGILSELGDCLWYLAAIAADLGTNLEVVAAYNLKKLERRSSEGKIKGAGDTR